VCQRQAFLRRPSLRLCEVAGPDKADAGLRLHQVLGLPPSGDHRAETGDVLYARVRKGSANTARGPSASSRSSSPGSSGAGAAGEIVVRFDSGLWPNRTLEVLGRLEVRYTMAVRDNSTVARAIAAIVEAAWVDIA
jgi:hypothetical protein